MKTMNAPFDEPVRGAPDECRPWRYAAKFRKRIYVVSRYAGNVRANTEAAVWYCRYVVDCGFLPVASHLLYPQILDDSDPEQRTLGMMFGLSLLRVCDEVWVFAPPFTWVISPGMAEEIREAQRLNLPLRWFDIDLTEISSDTVCTLLGG